MCLGTWMECRQAMRRVARFAGRRFAAATVVMATFLGAPSVAPGVWGQEENPGAAPRGAATEDSPATHLSRADAEAYVARLKARMSEANAPPVTTTTQPQGMVPNPRSLTTLMITISCFSRFASFVPASPVLP